MGSPGRGAFLCPGREPGEVGGFARLEPRRGVLAAHPVKTPRWGCAACSADSPVLWHGAKKDAPLGLGPGVGCVLARTGIVWAMSHSMALAIHAVASSRGGSANWGYVRGRTGAAGCSAAGCSEPVFPGLHGLRVEDPPWRASRATPPGGFSERAWAVGGLHPPAVSARRTSAAASASTNPPLTADAGQRGAGHFARVAVRYGRWTARPPGAGCAAEAGTGSR